MDGHSEQEELIALIESPGWRLFSDHLAQHYSAQMYRDLSRRAIVESIDPAEVPQKLIQLEARFQEVERIMLWPSERIKKLESMRVRA